MSPVIWIDLLPEERVDKLIECAKYFWQVPITSPSLATANVHLTTQSTPDAKNGLREESKATKPSSTGQPPVPPQRNRGSAKRPKDLGWWIGGFMFGFIIGLALALSYGWVLDPRPLPRSG